MPRLHPTMEVEELQPSRQHPNEYVTEQDLAEAKLFEFEMEQRWRLTQEEEQRRLGEEKEKEAQKEDEVDEVEGNEETDDDHRGEDPITKADEDNFHKNARRP